MQSKDYRKSRNMGHIDPITPSHPRHSDNISYNAKKVSKENSTVPKKGFLSTYNRDIARKTENKDILKSPIKNSTPIHKTQPVDSRIKEHELLSRTKKHSDTKYSHTAKNSPLNSKNVSKNYHGNYSKNTHYDTKDKMKEIPARETYTTKSKTDYDYNKFSTNAQRKTVNTSVTPTKEHAASIHNKYKEIKARFSNEILKTNLPTSMNQASSITPTRLLNNVGFNQSNAPSRDDNKYMYLELSPSKKELSKNYTPVCSNKHSRNPIIDRNSHFNRSLDTVKYNVELKLNRPQRNSVDKAITPNRSSSVFSPVGNNESSYQNVSDNYRILHDKSNIENDTYKVNHGSNGSLNRSSNSNNEMYLRTKSINVTPPKNNRASIVHHCDSLLQRSNCSKLSVNYNHDKCKDCDIWKIKYDTLMTSIKHENSSLDAFKTLLKDRDCENSGQVEQNYKLTNEVARTNSQLREKEREIDELVKLRDNLLDANNNISQEFIKLKNNQPTNENSETLYENKYRSILKDNKHLSDHNEKLRRELSQLKTEYHCYQTSVELDKTTTEKLTNEIDVKNEHLTNYAEKFAKLKIKNDELTKRITYLEKNNVRNSESSNFNVKTLENLENTNTSLLKNNGDLKSIIEDYESDLKDYNLMQNENTRLRGALKKREKDIELNRFKDEENEISLRDMSNVEHENEQLTKKVADLKKIIEGFEKDSGLLGKLQDENTMLKKYSKKKDDEISDLSKRLYKDVEYNEKNNDEVSEIIDDLKAKNLTLYTTNAEYILRIEQLEKELRNCSYKDVHTDKIRSLQSKKDTQILELNKQIEFMENNPKSDDMSLVRMQSLQDELDQTKSELSNLREKYKESKKYEGIEKSYNELQKKYKQANDEIFILKSKNDELINDLREFDKNEMYQNQIISGIYLEFVNERQESYNSVAFSNVQELESIKNKLADMYQESQNKTQKQLNAEYSYGEQKKNQEHLIRENSELHKKAQDTAELESISMKLDVTMRENDLLKNKCDSFDAKLSDYNDLRHKYDLILKENQSVLYDKNNWIEQYQVLENDYFDLEHKLREVQENCDKMSMMFESQIKNLKKSLNHVEEKLYENDKSYNELLLQNDVYKITIDELRDAKSMIDEKNYEKEIKKLNQKILELTQKLEFSYNELTNKQKVLSNYEKENTNKANKIDKLESDIGNLNDSYDQLSKERETDANNYEKRIQELERIIEGFKNIEQPVFNQKFDVGTETDLPLYNPNDDEAKMKSLEKEIRFYKNENYDMREVIDDLQKEIERLKSLQTQIPSEPIIKEISKDRLTDFIEYTNSDMGNMNDPKVSEIEVKKMYETNQNLNNSLVVLNTEFKRQQTEKNLLANRFSDLEKYNVELEECIANFQVKIKTGQNTFEQESRQPLLEISPMTTTTNILKDENKILKNEPKNLNFREKNNESDLNEYSSIDDTKHISKKDTLENLNARKEVSRDTLSNTNEGYNISNKNLTDSSNKQNEITNKIDQTTVVQEENTEFDSSNIMIEQHSSQSEKSENVLIKKLVEKDEEIVRLSDDNDKINELLNEKQQQIENMRNDMKNYLNNREEVVEHENNKLDDLANEFTEKENYLNKQIEELETDNTNLKKLLEHSGKQMEEGNSALDKLNSDLRENYQKLNEELTSYKKLDKTNQGKIVYLNDIIQEKDIIVEDYNENMTKKDMVIEDLNQSLGKKNEELEKINDSLKDKKIFLKAKEQEVEELNQDVEALKFDLEEKIKYIDDMKSSLDEKDLDFEALKMTVNDRENALKQKKSQDDDPQLDYEKITSELTKQNEKEIEAQKDSHNEKIDILTKEKTEILQQIEDLTKDQIENIEKFKKTEEYKNDLVKDIKASHDMLKAELDETKQVLSENQKELEDLNSNLLDKQEQINIMESKLKELDKEKSNYQGEVIKYNKMIEEITEDLSIKTSELERLNDLVFKNSNKSIDSEKVDDMKEEADKMKNLLQNTDEKLNVMTKENLDLKNSNQNLRKENAVLENKLKDSLNNINDKLSIGHENSSNSISIKNLAKEVNNDQKPELGLEKILEENTDLKETLDGQSKEIGDLKEKLSNINVNDSEQVGEIEKLKLLIKEQLDQIQNLTTNVTDPDYLESENMQHEIDELKEVLQNTEEALKDNIEVLRDKDSEIKKLKNTSAFMEMQKMKTTVSEQKARITKLTESLKAQKDDNKKLVIENKDLSKSGQLTERNSSKGMGSEYAISNKSIALEKSGSKDLEKSGSKDLKRSQDSFNKKIPESPSKLSTDSKDNIVADLKKELSQKQNKMNLMSKDLSKKDNVIQELNEELKLIKDENKEIGKLRKEIAQLKKQIKDLEKK